MIHLTATEGILFFACAVTVAAVSLWILRDRIWNIFDPLIPHMIFVAINVAVILVLDSRVDHVAYVLICFASFVTSFRWLGRVRSRNDTVPAAFRGPSRQSTLVLLAFTSLFLLIGMAFLVWRVGWGIFSVANPDEIKVTATQEGMGIFRYVQTTAILLFPPLLAHAWWVHRTRLVTIVALFLFLLYGIVFNFSKAGLVFLVFDLGILMHYYRRATDRRMIPAGVVWGALAVAIIPALLVLTVLSRRYGTSIGELVLIRLVMTAGGSYAYFVSDGMRAVADWGVLERLGYYFENLLAPLQLKEWAPLNTMSTIVYELTGAWLPGFAPNPYLFVDGHFLMRWGGILYCGFLGGLLAGIRSLRVDVLSFFVLVKLAFFMLIDPGVAMTHVVSLLLVLPVLFLLVLVFGSQGKRAWVVIPHTRS